MDEWVFSKREVELIARCLGFALQDGDLLNLEEEGIVQSILDEMNGTLQGHGGARPRHGLREG